MDPNNEYQPPQNQYDFILNSDKKTSRNPFSGGSQKRRIMIVAVGLLALIIIATIVFSIIGNAGRPTYDDTLRIITIQRQIIQASDMAMSSSPNADTRIKAATIASTTYTVSQQLEAFMTTNKQEKKLKNLPSSDTKLKENLERAISNNNFDNEYNKTIDSLFNKYTAELRISNQNSKSKKEKAILEQAYDNIQTIQGPVEDASAPAQ